MFNSCMTLLAEAALYRIGCRRGLTSCLQLHKEVSCRIKTVAELKNNKINSKHTGGIEGGVGKGSKVLLSQIGRSNGKPVNG